MTSDRKKPGVAFWATLVVVVGLVAYPLSFVPACWVSSRVQPTGTCLSAVYRPIILAWRNSPPSAENLVTRSILFGIRGYRIEYRTYDRGGIRFPP
jgi:hypothetical protein